MISHIITRLTGRSYSVRREDLGYVFSKGAIPLARGAFWSILRWRRSRGLALGAGIQFIEANRFLNGRGVAIGAYSYIDCSAEAGVNLADRVTIRERAWIQSRSGLNERAVGLWIGERSYLGPNAVIGLGGPVHIGINVQIGAGLTLSAEAHEADANGGFTTGKVSRRGIRIGNDCWLGVNVTVLDGVDIGEGAVIGAGSIVTRSIPSRSVAYGSPARVVRKLD